MIDRQPRIRLFNVKYSPNLGDGLLSECLEMAMKECGSDASQTYSVDLSARTAYERGNASRSTVLKVLSGLPGPLRQLATSVPRELLLRKRWRPHYERHLSSADAMVVGGGNLLTDMDLNFPVKVASALEMAALRKVPAAVYGVGVSSSWSAKGTRLLQRALERAKPAYVSVRDEGSKRNFDRLFADAAGREAIVVRDPGLLIARYAKAETGAVPERIGLCITSSIAIRYHSSETVTDADMAAWYRALCAALSAKGHPIVVFTNGSPEDEVVLDQIEASLRESCTTGFERRRLRTPTELAGLIGSLSGLVAHRMHAIIAGVSFGIPVYALLWDEKLEAFMRSIGEAGSMAHSRPGNAEDVANGLFRRRSTQARQATSELIDETFASTKALFQLLSR